MGKEGTWRYSESLLINLSFLDSLSKNKGTRRSSCRLWGLA